MGWSLCFIGSFVTGKVPLSSASAISLFRSSLCSAAPLVAILASLGFRLVSSATFILEISTDDHPLGTLLSLLANAYGRVKIYLLPISKRLTFLVLRRIPVQPRWCHHLAHVRYICFNFHCCRPLLGLTGCYMCIKPLDIFVGHVPWLSLLDLPEVSYCFS